MFFISYLRNFLTRFFQKHALLLQNGMAFLKINTVRNKFSHVLMRLNIVLKQNNIELKQNNTALNQYSIKPAQFNTVLKQFNTVLKQSSSVINKNRIRIKKRNTLFFPDIPGWAQRGVLSGPKNTSERPNRCGNV